MMPPKALLDLPPELLEHILLVLFPADFVSSMLTCKRLFSVSEKARYHHRASKIYHTVGNSIHRKYDTVRGPLILTQFLEDVSEDRGLSLYVKELFLRQPWVPDTPCDQLGDQHCLGFLAEPEPTFATLLCKLPNLSKVGLGGGGSVWSDAAIQQLEQINTEAESKPLCFLTEASLNQSTPDRQGTNAFVRALAFFLTLPSIEAVHADQAQHSTWSTVAPSLLPAGSSSVKNLSLWGHGIGGSVLKQIMESVQALRSFACCIFPMSDEHTRVIQSALEASSRQSLHRLVLREGDMDWHCGDWTGFPKLKTFATNALSLLLGCYAVDAREDAVLLEQQIKITALRDKLPPSVRELYLNRDPTGAPAHLSGTHVFSMLLSLLRLKDQLFPDLVHLVRLTYPSVH